MWERSLVLTILGFQIISPFAVNAQDDENTVKTPLQLQAEETELLKQIEEAELAILTAQKNKEALGEAESEGSGTAGTITIGEEVGFYGEILAYESLKQAAQIIVNSVKVEIDETGEEKKKELLLTTNYQLEEQGILWNVINNRAAIITSRLDANIDEFNEEGITEIERQVTELLQEANAASLDQEDELINIVQEISATGLVGGIAVATEVLTSLSDLASFFKVNRAISNREVTLSTNALLAEVAKQYMAEDKEKKGVRFLDYNFGITGTITETISDIVEKNIALMSKKDEIQDKYERLLEELVKLRNQVATDKIRMTRLGNNDPARGALQNTISLNEIKIVILSLGENTWKATDQKLSAMINAVTDFYEDISKNENGKPSLLQSVAKYDYLQTNKSNRLLVEISAKGAELEKTEGALFGSGKLTYMGGVVVTYLLLDSEGNYKTSGVVSFVRGQLVKKLADINTSIEPVDTVQNGGPSTKTGTPPEAATGQL